MRKPISKLRLWVLLCGITTGLSGLTYTVAQQVMRQTANDPQIQLAEDATTNLSNGKSPQDVMLTTQVDPGASLAPFEIFYDTSGHQIASSVSGKTLTLPSGVFTSAKKMGESRVTWQPSSNIRIAAVIKHYDNGYVLAGRSLRDVETRALWLLERVGLIWAGLIIAVTTVIIW